jgi:hypothetical protein
VRGWKFWYVQVNIKNAVAVGTIPQMWVAILRTLNSAVAASVIYLALVKSARLHNQIRLL